MADMDRVELLLGLSNNMRTENAEWRREVFQEGRARAVRCRDLMVRFEQEYGALSQEMDRLNQYLPRQQQQLPEEGSKAEQLPKTVTQGRQS
jgi:hypothetical protein